MILTPLMWSCLDLFSKYYSHFWPHPFEWDPSRKKFVANPKSTKLLFYFLSMATLVCSPICSVILVAANSSAFINLTFFDVLGNILFLFVEVLTLVTELSFSFYAEELKLFGNYLKRLDAQIRSRKLTQNMWWRNLFTISNICRILRIRVKLYSQLLHEFIRCPLFGKTFTVKVCGIL